MFNLPEKFVIVDGYRIPADKAEAYRKQRNGWKKKQRSFSKAFVKL